MPIVFTDDLAKSLKMNPGSVAVFGDNLERWGEGGQASIRHTVGSLGVATKRAPSMREGSFFSDQSDEVEAVRHDLERVRAALDSGRVVFVSVHGLGTGRALLEEKSPKIHSLLKEFFKWP